MSCDHHNTTTTTSMHLEVLHDEVQNLKDEIQREKRKQATIYQRVTTMLRDNAIPMQQDLGEKNDDALSPRQLQDTLQQKIDHYTKVQQVLSLQVQHTESLLANATSIADQDDEDGPDQDLDTLLATLKQDLADADEQLKALQG